jgi:hypothetical protein
MTPSGMHGVTQADRDAAADFWESLGKVAWADWQADWMRDGTADAGLVTPAFTRHRQQATAELVEALSLYVSICGNTAYSVDREMAQVAYAKAMSALSNALTRGVE